MIHLTAGHSDCPRSEKEPLAVKKRQETVRRVALDPRKSSAARSGPAHIRAHRTSANLLRSDRPTLQRTPASRSPRVGGLQNAAPLGHVSAPRLVYKKAYKHRRPAVYKTDMTETVMRLVLTGSQERPQPYRVRYWKYRVGVKPHRGFDANIFLRSLRGLDKSDTAAC